MTNNLPVSVYFTTEWWDRNFHADRPRPERPAAAALEEIYLARQRFLFEQFGAWGMGAERPALGPGQIATVILYGFDLIPALLGTQLDFADAWGFFPRHRPLAELRDLQPVDVAGTADGARIVREKERCQARYGGCSHCLDIASVTNNAFRILGEDFYADLLAEPEAVRRLLDVILQTIGHLHRFLADQFGGMDPVPIGNCNVSLMGPATYREMIFAYDAEQNRLAQRRSGAPPRAALHHCDVPVDDFLEAYAGLPGLASLQASLLSDIAAVRRRLPDCAFSALVSPVMLDNLTILGPNLQRALRDGVADLAVWNIDAGTAPAQLRAVFGLMQQLAAACGRQAQFSAMPLCWEELEWAHARYRSR